MFRGLGIALMLCFVQLRDGRVLTQQPFPEAVVLYLSQNPLTTSLEQTENPTNIYGQRVIIVFEPNHRPDPVKSSSQEFYGMMSWFVPICTGVVVAVFIYWLVHHVKPIAHMQVQLGGLLKDVEKLQKCVEANKKPDAC